MDRKTNMRLYPQNEKIFSNLSVAQINILKTGIIYDFKFWNYEHICDYFWHLYCNPDSKDCGVRIEDQFFPLNDNRMLIIPPYTIYSVYSSSPIQHFFVHFIPEGNIFSVCRRPWYIPSDLPMIQQIECIMNAGSDISWQLPCLVAGMVQRALGMLPAEAFLHSQSGTEDPRIDNAIKFYMNSTDKKIKNSAVAKKLGMSIQNFERKFKLQTGITPRKFHRLRQMQIVADMLRFTQVSIEDIAIKVGYADRFILSRIFKQHYGISPAAYRKQHQHSKS